MLRVMSSRTASPLGGPRHAPSRSHIPRPRRRARADGRRARDAGGIGDCAPKVTAVSPRSGPAAGGTRVTITGTGFAGLTRSRVTFGTTAATKITVVSSTKVTATAPKGAAGRVNVHIVTTHGTSASNSTDGFTYIAKPTITSVTQNVGQHRVVGTRHRRFRPHRRGNQLPHRHELKFADKTMSGVTELDANHLEFTSPKHAPGRSQHLGDLARRHRNEGRRIHLPQVVAEPDNDRCVRRCARRPVVSGSEVLRDRPVQQPAHALRPDATMDERGNPISPGNTIDDLSCATDTFCAAVDHAGHASTYNGTKWTQSASMTHVPRRPAREGVVHQHNLLSRTRQLQRLHPLERNQLVDLRPLDGTLITKTTLIPPTRSSPDVVVRRHGRRHVRSCAMIDGNGDARTFIYNLSERLVASDHFTDHGYPDRAVVLRQRRLPVRAHRLRQHGQRPCVPLRADSWGAASSVAPGFQLSSVSCSQSTSVCRAVDNGGNAYTLGTTGRGAAPRRQVQVRTSMRSRAVRPTASQATGIRRPRLTRSARAPGARRRSSSTSTSASLRWPAATRTTAWRATADS